MSCSLLPISIDRSNIRVHERRFPQHLSEANEEIMKAQGTENSKTSIIALFTMVFMWAASAQLFAQHYHAFSGLQKHINKLATVDTQDGHVTGHLLRVEESRLVVYEAGMPKPIARESVKKATRHMFRHTVAWVAGMSAAGLGTGFSAWFPCI
jgi:hypothetical protein